ncbi:MAG: ATP-binding protein [Actinomycetota bacterium]|nr:ATP-binding protein [Actinomycetota bacterium]
MDLELPGGPLAPKMARAAVAELEEELPPEVLDDVRLVVSELVTNSVRHGGAGPAERVQLRITLEESIVRLEVSDPGPGPPTGRPEPRSDQTGGWGLLVVDRVADRWGVRPGRPGRPPAVWAELSAA